MLIDNEKAPLFSLAVISSVLMAGSWTLIVTQVIPDFKIHELTLIGTDIFILWSLTTLLFNSGQEFQSLDWMVVDPLYTQSWSVS